MSELEAVIFDLGGVLTTPILASFQRFEESLGLETGTLVRVFRRDYSTVGAGNDFHLLEIGEITEAEYYRRLEALIREETRVDVRLGDDPMAIRRGLWGGIRRNEEMIEVARRIGGHYRTALLTNNVREWGGWRQYYPQDLFEVVIDSSEVGMRKPDHAIYWLTCDRLGVDPSHAAFVDDIPDNVAAAREVGLHGIHFTDTHAVIEELERLFPRAFAAAS